ncbi:hypothetical protein FOZ63_008012 [Perkinsus olseni]|uniref:Uncharacterized protein n=1 Tax=Perkinsus olseni TaxID=32597 RepID=A0A7J6TCA3_PEROL|nr:hypothetical protein FOZ62_024899 [Perkinsus olseni]KAF4742743.1 hypothetical protein FOZ63_008012 [Perkinsus olseni]
MLGHSLLSVLPALATVTMAMQTASQSKVIFNTIGRSCEKLYSPPGKEHFLGVYSDLSVVIFKWRKSENYEFDFWAKRQDDAQGLTVKRHEEAVSVKGASKEMVQAFGGVNPFAHLVEDIPNEFSSPFRMSECMDVLRFIEGKPAEGYEDAGKDWVDAFIDDKITAFFEKAREWKARSVKKD